MINYKDLRFHIAKLGGTSVASPGCWKHVIDEMSALRDCQEHPVLVCSAVSGVTNLLESLVMPTVDDALVPVHLQEIEDRHKELADQLGCADAIVEIREDLRVLRELCELAGRSKMNSTAQVSWQAQVMAQGELMSTRLMAAVLRARGLKVRWADARMLLRARRKAGSNSAQHYLSAECDDTPNPALQRTLQRGDFDLTITQGFIASNLAGETVLLGRGGSDTSAALLASILQAKRLHIWTDVPGFFTCDPRRVSDANLVPELSYDEAAVLCALGAKILHPRCLGPLHRRGIDVRIRWSHDPAAQGTRIHGCDGDGIRAMSSRDQLVLLSMKRNRQWQPVGFMAEVATCFHKHGLSMDLVSSSSSEIRATIDLAANPGARRRISALFEDLNTLSETTIHEGLACVSLVGTRVGTHLSKLAHVIELLERQRVHLVSHGADDTHLSFVVDVEVRNGLVGAMHSQIFADTQTEGGRWSDIKKEYAFSFAPAGAAEVCA